MEGCLAEALAPGCWAVGRGAAPDGVAAAGREGPTSPQRCTTRPRASLSMGKATSQCSVTMFRAKTAL